jgi:hypothetical protein
MASSLGFIKYIEAPMMIMIRNNPVNVFLSII